MLEHQDYLLKNYPPHTLVFVDPPFNINRDYGGFKDYRPDYNDWLEKVVKKAWAETHSVLCLHGPDHVCEQYLRIMGNTPRLSWIIWHYTFGQYQESNWTNAHCHCLVYAKPGHAWHPAREPSVREKMGDSRAKAGGRIPGTVWSIPRIVGNSKERRPMHDNQLPMAYVQRFIEAYTDPGDSVLDPFMGSGTVAHVCRDMGREYTGCDIMEWCVLSVKERLM